jgi:ferric-dicitrate binding protein FerR (iron transport regulator)
MNTMEARLFTARFVSGEYTPGEYEAFLSWLDEAPLNDVEQVIGAHEALRGQWPIGAGPSARWVEQMERKLDIADANDQRTPVKKLSPVRPVKRLPWRLAAACVLVLIVAGICAYWYVSRSGQGSSGNKTETLSILSVPKGQTGWVQLADGSKVWLNAASTLHYPLAFAGKERVVELSGEALFEIAPNANAPFVVRSGDQRVEVLGTRFDMMAYADEPVSKTSLFEGSVKIVSGSETAILHPGDQAETDHVAQGNNGAIRVTHGVDPESILAWKEGYMQFSNTDLQSVMREIARSYDYSIQYEGKIAKRFFTGKFSRNEDIDQILRILELQHVHFKINGKMITVLP